MPSRPTLCLPERRVVAVIGTHCASLRTNCSVSRGCAGLIGWRLRFRA